jgi:hypothetical protein
MKKPVLVLLTLLALLPFAQLLAQAPPAHSATAPASDVAQFLATLSSGPAHAPSDWVPAPSFRASCTSNADCPASKLCCNVCGTPPDDGSSCLACVTPIRGHCPLVG